MKKNKILWIAICALIFFSSQLQAQVSFPPITINLTYPQFQRLKIDNGYIYLEDAGMRGIILYRLGENSYIAFERACPYHLQANCAQVQVDGSGLFLVDPCCKSSYNLSDGQPTGGPAQRALFQYRIEMTSETVLKITDEISN